MKIYTKSGDLGETSLMGGTRVPKHHIRVETYGLVDELNSHTGLLKEQLKDFPDIQNQLSNIQNQLFTLQSVLALEPDTKKHTYTVKPLPQISPEDIESLEKLMDAMNEKLPELKSFIIPCGNIASAQCHITRTLCRRTERTLCKLHDKEPVNELILKHINRLSDYYFVLARYINFLSETPDTPWEPNKNK